MHAAYVIHLTVLFRLLGDFGRGWGSRRLPVFQKRRDDVRKEDQICGDNSCDG